jgi:phenylacetate-CoA ligase
VTRLQDAVARRIVVPLQRSRFRPGFGAAGAGFREGLAAREAAARLDPAHRARRAVDLLARAVRRAGETVPFWRGRFRAAGFDWRAPFSLEAFAALPPLERSEIEAAGDSILSTEAAAARGRLIADATGGSTGEPLRFLLDPWERGFLDAGAEWHYRAIGCPPGRRTALLYGGEADPLVRTGAARRARNWATNVLALPCFRLDADFLERAHAAFERFRPELLVAYASAVHELAIHLRDSGRKASYPSVAIVTAAEKLRDDARETIESVFSARAFERYGSRELGLVACRVSAFDAALSVDLEHALAEPEGAPGPDGTAPILVTRLSARAMPFFRYRVGDVGRFDAGARDPATGIHASIAEVTGREMDFLVRRDGGVVHPVELPHFFKDLPVREYQAAQDASGEVLVSVVGTREFRPEHRERIASVLERNLGGFPVRVIAVDRIARNASAKLRPVVSALARARGASGAIERKDPS